MNTSSRQHSKSGGFLRRLLFTGLSIWMLGAVYTPALAAVAVDQSPLIIQQSLPPNITLMLDDSGSMDSDYMPDQGYLPSDIANTTSNPDSYRINSNNGTYFDPSVTYNTPPYATTLSDGTTNYPTSANMAAAPDNGFSGYATDDITSYTGIGNYKYYTSLQVATTSIYAPSPTYSYSCPRGGTIQFYDGTYYYCYYNYNYYVATQTVSGSVCNGNDPKNANGQCVSTSKSNKNFFTYDTGTATGKISNGTLVRNYVGKNAGDCASLTSAANQSVCKDDAVTQQNVATWFSFYRTRLLLAKSGLMSSFATIDPTFRVGFGSINGKNNANLPVPTGIYGNKTIAKVTPFGNGLSGSQRAKFWNWVAGETADGSTPLRSALDAVGTYYQSSQPWQTSAADTTELACRQSYTILTTDGFWRDETISVGNADNTKATVTGPNGQSYTYNPAAPYSDSNSNTLADVAMKYWVTDLRSSSPNEVPTSAEDPAFWQHMTTFTLGLGFTPKNITPKNTTIQQIFDWANGGAPITGFGWPTPADNNINNITDLAHAAVNGHGGFYSATSPDAFTSGLSDALKRATERVGTGASLAANSTQLSSGAFAYQANYYTAKWKGDLKAIALDPNTGALAATPTWTASTVLPAFASRKIYTYNPEASTPSVVLFSSPTGLSAAEDAALGGTATAQQSMINYLRGDSSLEQKNAGGTFRNRDTPLGDIVDSQPIYVGQPDVNQFSGQTFSGSTTYATYANTSRTGQIYVAANDGMLHAFDAATGVETFAYIPAAVITSGASSSSGLSSLADTDYGITTAVPHQYFNDGELTVADVYFSSAWHSVAVGTSGRGGAKAIYALDVTNPASISLLWERSAGDTKANAGYIGQMTGKPVIAQVADGSWSVVMGNGYNSANGVAALLQFAIADGSLTVHQTDMATSNGLAAPGVWIGGQTNGISTIAYAGDVQGREWSFVMNNGTASQPSSSGTRLFTAKDSAGNIQPITAGTLLGKDPATGNLWVFLGTGQYLSASDLASTSAQSWYGLIVQSATTGLALDGSQNRSKLVQRSIVAETAGTAAVLNSDGSVKTAAIAPARAITAAPTTPDLTGKSGWYIDLLSPTSSTNSTTGNATYTPNQVAQGERIVTPNLFQGNQLIATTRIPQAIDVCNPSGRGWIMSVNPFTGTAPSSSFFDLNGDGQINQPADFILVNGSYVPSSGIGFSSLPNNPIFVGGSMLVSFDNGSSSSIKTSGSGAGVNRVSWRELINQ